MPAFKRNPWQRGTGDEVTSWHFMQVSALGLYLTCTGGNSKSVVQTVLLHMLRNPVFSSSISGTHSRSRCLFIQSCSERCPSCVVRSAPKQPAFFGKTEKPTLE
eukprot:scpid86194/ scgid34072/ 